MESPFIDISVMMNVTCAVSWDAYVRNTDVEGPTRNIQSQNLDLTPLEKSNRVETKLFFKNDLVRNLKAKNERNKIAFLQSFGNSNSFFYLISSAFSQSNIKIDTRAVE